MLQPARSVGPRHLWLRGADVRAVRWLRRDRLLWWRMWARRWISARLRIGQSSPPVTLQDRPPGSCRLRAPSTVEAVVACAPCADSRVTNVVLAGSTLTTHVVLRGARRVLAGGRDRRGDDGRVRHRLLAAPRRVEGRSHRHDGTPRSRVSWSVVAARLVRRRVRVGVSAAVPASRCAARADSASATSRSRSWVACW